MKTLFSFLLLFFALHAVAQVPQGINYQTVVRDNSGSLITDQNVTFRFSVISGSASGMVIYTEVHNTATNALGLVNLIIGQGTPVTGSFPSIAWSDDAHYLSVEIDPQGGSNFIDMGTSQLMSVPYALNAGSAATSMAQLTDVDISGVEEGQVLKWNGTAWLPATDNDTNTDEQTLNISGNTLSIIGGNSVTLPVDSSGWGLTGNTGTNSDNNFIGTTDDQPLVFRTNNAAKARLTTKGQLEILNTGNSVFIGEGAGANDDLSDNQNVFIGKDAGTLNSTGTSKTANGYQALYSNTTGSNLVAIGDSAMYSYSGGMGQNTAVGSKTLYSNTMGSSNTAIGYRAMYSNVTGMGNTANGSEALRSNSSGGYNTANGYQAMYSNTSGMRNTAIGSEAMRSNTGGHYNTAYGYQAMYSNTTGVRNTANGNDALYSNTIGTDNSAFGTNALRTNTGKSNTAMGSITLYSNTTGESNTAIGASALNHNISGSNNAAYGLWALGSNTIGSSNVAVGIRALYTNYTGNKLVAIGDSALYNHHQGMGQNTAVGSKALYSNIAGSGNTANGYQTLMYNTTGSNNTAVGLYAGVGASGIDFNSCTFVGCNSTPTAARTNVTMLGAGIANGQCTDNNQVLLGNTATTQIRAQITGITAYSDAHFKTNVQHDVKGLDFISRLQPVTYNERPEELHKIWGTPDSLLRQIDHSEINNTRFIGFLAQDVAKAAKESGFDFPGIDEPRNTNEVYTLRYTDFIMPLVAGMQEQQKMIEQQQQEIDELKKMVNALIEKSEK